MIESEEIWYGSLYQHSLEVNWLTAGCWHWQLEKILCRRFLVFYMFQTIWDQFAIFFPNHIGILIESVEIHYGRFYYHSLGVKLVNCWMPVPVTGLPALATGKNKILQIDSKWFEMCKKHDNGNSKFLSIASSRRSTFFTSSFWSF